MRYALSIVGALALYWCLINLAAAARSHVEQRRRAMDRHPTSQCEFSLGGNRCLLHGAHLTHLSESGDQWTYTDDGTY